jgi:hypothetical protein
MPRLKVKYGVATSTTLLAVGQRPNGRTRVAERENDANR